MFDDLAFIDTKEGHKSTPVKVYALSSCDHCKAGMNLIKSLALRYKYIYVDTLPPEFRIRIKKEIAAAFHRNLLFPMLELPENEFLFGYDEGIWRKRLEEFKAGLSGE
jgi:glutaredoxin